MCIIPAHRYFSSYKDFIMKSILQYCLFFALVAATVGFAHAEEGLNRASLPSGKYVVVASQRTAADPEWRKAIDALVAKRSASVLEFVGDVNETLPELRKIQPRYICFVAQPDELGRDFIVAVNRMTRRIDDDPYGDALWGVITGYKATDAQRIIAQTDPLVIRRAAAGTSLDLNLFDEGIWSDEGSDVKYHEKKSDGIISDYDGPAFASETLAETLNHNIVDLFFTSGHATERDWQVGYPPHKRGEFRCKNGELYAVGDKGEKTPIRTTNPKVFLPSGNCLAGKIVDDQSMAVAWLSSGGVDQMIGYVVSTWYGKAGWGTRDYLFERPGQYCLSEAFFFNNQAIVETLETQYPKTARANFCDWAIERDPFLLPLFAKENGIKLDGNNKDNVGLIWDRDTLAFYGDPAWDARLAPRDPAFAQELKEDADGFSFTVRAIKDCEPTAAPAAWLPKKAKNPRIVEGAELKPLVTDDFLMLPRLGKLKAGDVRRIRIACDK